MVSMSTNDVPELLGELLPEGPTRRGEPHSAKLSTNCYIENTMAESRDPKFELLDRAIARGGVDAALEWLAEDFTRQKQYAELFEVLKMRARRQVGLPLTQTEEEPVADEPTQERLERLLFQACGQVGELLFRDGRAALAWKYFQLVGDRSRARQLLREIPPTADNATELIDVALGEGVDPVYGIELTLQFAGTCNAITSMDQVMPFEKSPVRDGAAAMLLQHVHRELLRNVAGEIESHEGQRPQAEWLGELIAERDWLFAGDSFQVDPSHLAATVRLGRMTTNREGLQIAADLCCYGQRLNPSLIGAGECPFENLFVAHELYFLAALRQGLDSAIPYFQSRVPPATVRNEPARAAAATLVDVLCRNRRWTEALPVSMDWLNGASVATGVVPSALEIARQCGQLDVLAAAYQAKGNLLMYGLAKLEQAGRPV